HLAWQPARIALLSDPVSARRAWHFLSPCPDTGIIACPSPEDRRNDGFPRQAARPQEERGRRGHEDRAASSLDAGGRHARAFARRGHEDRAASSLDAGGRYAGRASARARRGPGLERRRHPLTLPERACG